MRPLLNLRGMQVDRKFLNAQLQVDADEARRHIEGKFVILISDDGDGNYLVHTSQAKGADTQDYTDLFMNGTVRAIAQFASGNTADTLRSLSDAIKISFLRFAAGQGTDKQTEHDLIKKFMKVIEESSHDEG